MHQFGQVSRDARVAGTPAFDSGGRPRESEGMTKDVSVQELQEHLAEHLEEVKRGVTLRGSVGENLLFVTHDSAQANAARALAFEVLYTP